PRSDLRPSARALPNGRQPTRHASHAGAATRPQDGRVPRDRSSPPHRRANRRLRRNPARRDHPDVLRYVSSTLLRTGRNRQKPTLDVNVNVNVNVNVLPPTLMTGRKSVGARDPAAHLASRSGSRDGTPKAMPDAWRIVTIKNQPLKG